MLLRGWCRRRHLKCTHVWLQRRIGQTEKGVWADLLHSLISVDARSSLFPIVELLVTPGLQVQCAVSILSKRIWQGVLVIPRSPRTPRDEGKGESHFKQRVVPAARKYGYTLLMIVSRFMSGFPSLLQSYPMQRLQCGEQTSCTAGAPCPILNVGRLVQVRQWSCD